jgi:orotate phosphoribosyltransferase
VASLLLEGLGNLGISFLSSYFRIQLFVPHTPLFYHSVIRLSSARRPFFALFDNTVNKHLEYSETEKGWRMDRVELARRVYSASHLIGTFRLRSGQVSDQYFDKYLFESDPVLLASIASHMVKLIPSETEVLAGLEMGGIPVATALSLQTGLPAIFVRKKAKEYGTAKLAEGLDFHGRRLCIVEDVVTTGGQIILSARDLRLLGGKVAEVICVIQRGKDAGDILRQQGLALRPLFTMQELERAR